MRDLSDGVILINLIQQLESNKVQPSSNPTSPTNANAILSPSSSSSSSSLFKSYHRAPKNPFQRSENLEQVLTFLRSQGSPLVGITAATLADGATHRDGATLKAALGLVWQLILRYDLNESGAQGAQQRRIASRSVSDEQGEAVHVSVTPRASAGSAREKLLRWVDDTVALQAGTAQPHLAVSSFGDLADGRAFAHLINALQPHTVDVSALSPTSRAANLRFVFDKAEEALGIPPVLSADELADAPDKVDSQSLMTYLSFFKAWRPQLLQRKSIKLTLGDVEQRKAALAAVAEAAAASPAQRHSPSVSFSGTGKALDTATQLELNEAKHTIAALQSALTDMQRSVSSKTREEEEKKQPTHSAHATQSSQTSTGSSAVEGQSLREQVEALTAERDELRLELEARGSSLSSSALSPSSSSSSSPSTSTPPSPSNAVEAKKLSLLEGALKKSLAMQKELALKVSASDASMQELRSTAEASSLQAKTLAEQVQRLEQEKAQADSHSQTATAASSTSTAAMKEGLEAIRAELTAAQAQAAANAARQAELQKAAAQAEAKADEQRLRYKQKIDQLEREASNTRTQLQALETTMSEQLSAAKRSLAQQSEQQSTFADLQGSLEESKTRASTLAEQVTALETAKAAGEAERAKMQAELKAELTAAQKTLQSNQQQTAATVAKAQSNEQELEGLQRRLASLAAEKDELRVQYEQRLSAAEAKAKAREAEEKGQEEQQRQMAELEQAMQTALSTAKQSAARQHDMEKALQELRASSTAATGKASALEGEVQRLEAEKTDSATQLQRLRAELSSTSAVVQEAQQRQTAQSTKLQTATATVAAAATATAASGLAEVEALKKERDSLREQVKQLQTKTARPSSTAGDGVATAQLKEQERQLAALQAELDEARQQAAIAAAVVPSHSTSAVPSGDGVDSSVLAELQAKAAFDLRMLEKEHQTRIASLLERIHALETAAKSVRASERELDEERSGWERRVREAEEELKRKEEAVKKERLRAEQALQEKKAVEEARRKGEEELRQRLDDAKETIALQRKEAQEGQALKKERAEQERRLGEERRKNRELLQRVEQIKRNRGEDAGGKEKDGAGRSVSQRGSRRTSRAVSPVPPSAARSFDGLSEGDAAAAMNSSVEEEKLPVVATATTDEEEGGGGARPTGKKKRKRKGGKGEAAEGTTSTSSAPSHLITVPPSAPSSQSGSRAHSPRGPAAASASASSDNNPALPSSAGTHARDAQPSHSQRAALATAPSRSSSASQAAALTAPLLLLFCCDSLCRSRSLRAAALDGAAQRAGRNEAWEWQSRGAGARLPPAVRRPGCAGGVENRRTRQPPPGAAAVSSAVSVTAGAEVTASEVSTERRIHPVPVRGLTACRPCCGVLRCPCGGCS